MPNCKDFWKPINRIELWKLVFIPANISTAVIYKRLHANGGIGILFESKADTMKNTLKSEWGTYDDLLRKAFHFEEATLERKDRYFKIEHPRLSVILSGTPNQIQGIIPDAENGLFSRFIFYTLLYYEESDGILFRLANITFRIAMILTISLLPIGFPIILRNDER